MRTLLVLSIAIALSFATLAAPPPERIPYTGVLRDTDGTALDGPHDMVLSLWSSGTAGDEIWIDAHLAAGTGAVSVDAGLFSVVIGSGAAADGSGPGVYTSPAQVFADHTDLYLEIEINGETLSPRVRVGSSAYAMNSASVEGKSVADLAADTTAMIGTHQSEAAAHHGRYTDSEAVTAVGNSLLVPPGQCTGSDEVLRWDGSGWSCCETLPPGVGSGPSSGDANGYEVVDPFGHGWDGLMRGLATWAEADADCRSLGGRLPTIGELWSVNTDDGIGSLTDSPVDDYVWTSIPATLDPDLVYIGRLSDGAFNLGYATGYTKYRCTWPGTSGDGFDADDCFGLPGNTCRPLGLWHNADDDPRLYPDTVSTGFQNLSYTMQTFECLQSGGSLADVRGAYRLSRAGGDASQVWTTNLANPATGQFSTAITTGDAYGVWGSFGLAADYPDYYYFGYCIGRRPGTPDVAPASPACQGGCYQPSLGGATLVADAASRLAEDHATATQTCRSIGGRLPRMGEILRLIFDGWSSGTGTAHWSADPGWDAGPVMTTYQWTGDGDGYWHPGANTDRAPASDTLPYRCVWPGAVEATPTVCAPNEDQTWDGSTFSCVAGTDGSSGGQATPSEFVDAWGNVWDASVRASGVFYTDAVEGCSTVGGRLPTAGEIYRVRHANGIAPALGDATATELLWTLTPGRTVGTVSATRLSDGIVVDEPDNNERAYRCIWPASQGDVLSGRSCHADPAESCFQAGGLRIDRLDRPELPYPAAAFECEFDGGQLPLLDELTRLIHAGAPGGGGMPLWLEHPVAEGAEEYYAAAGWSGAGSTEWSFEAPNAGTIAPSAVAPFRCVFSNEHDY